MLLKISCIQQLQKDNFLLVNIWLLGVLGLVLKIVGPFGHMNERHDNCLVIGVFMYISKISGGQGQKKHSIMGFLCTSLQGKVPTHKITHLGLGF
jgi:hypothetical protein